MESREDLAARLNAIPGVNIDHDLLMTGWSSIPLSVLAPPRNLEDFKAAIRWAVGRVYEGTSG